MRWAWSLKKISTFLLRLSRTDLPYFSDCPNLPSDCGENMGRGRGPPVEIRESCWLSVRRVTAPRRCARGATTRNGKGRGRYSLGRGAWVGRSHRPGPASQQGDSHQPYRNPKPYAYMTCHQRTSFPPHQWCGAVWARRILPDS
jgi:hypothetical protein